MSVWGQVTWDVARAGGFVGYALLTLAVALGLALSMQWQAPRWPRVINSELHNFVTLLSMVFVVIHVLAVWLDPFTAFGWAEVFIPLVSHYRALWMASGIVALYLGLALAASVWLRPYIGYEWWRRLHVLTLVVYLLVTVHGLTTGSDTRTVWGIAIYALSALSISALLWMRLLVPTGPQQRRHPVWVGITALALFVGVIATVLGPMRAGWNAFANGNSGSGQRGATTPALVAQRGSASGATVTAGATTAALVAPFLATMAGTVTQSGPDGTGDTQMIMRLSLHDSQTDASDVVSITFAGTTDEDGALTLTSSQIRLGPSASVTTYSGQLGHFSADNGHWRLRGTLRPTNGAGSPMDLLISLTMQSGGQVTGQAQAVAATSGADGTSDGGD